MTEGNKPAAVRLMQELEIQTLITRFGLDGIVPEQDPDTLPEVDAAIASLPAEPSGHYLVAARPAVLGKKSAVVQPEAGTPCRTPPCIPSLRRSWSPCWTTPG